MYDKLVKRLRQDVPTALVNCDFDFVEGWIEEAADAIEELICEVADEHNARLDAEERHRWIPVTERLPELCQNVLVSDGKRSGEGWLDRYDWHDPNREDVVYTSPRPRDFWCIPGCKVDEDHVTHWQPLPEPPKEET